MMPLATIRDPRASSRRARAERALDLLKLMETKVDVPSAIRWEGWQSIHDMMLTAFTPETLMSFKSHPILAPAISGGRGDYLERARITCGHELVSFLLTTFRETLCGEPPDLTCIDGVPITHTSLRHLYYLAIIFRFCRRYFGRPVEFVEVGGGFGNLARLTVQYSLSSRHTIIDFPPSLCMQYFFLGEFLEESDVAVWTGSEYLAGSDASRVRLAIPNATDAVGYELASPSFLVSTMAITEIPETGQTYYLDRIKPTALYVTGQTVLDAFASAQALGTYAKLSNRSLFYRLAEMCHPVEFREGDYYTDFLGIVH